MTNKAYDDVKKVQRKHRQVSIPLLQAKLKLSHDQAKKFIEELRIEAEKRQKVSKNSRPS